MIQSLGTPYNGNTAAGSAANLGEIFGVGCGSNSDLRYAFYSQTFRDSFPHFLKIVLICIFSRDGAVNWVSGISAATRADVHFYTTTYQQGNFFGDYCSLPMNLVLQWPNDGVTELTYAALTGANNQGNTEKWCHSTEMGYPAQYDDRNRNAQLNSLAAR